MEIVTVHKRLSFLCAYSKCNHIQMHSRDKEKMVFITKMPTTKDL